MQHVGVGIWVVILVIGVVSNILSSARKQRASRYPSAAPPAQPPPQQPVRNMQDLVAAMQGRVRVAPAPTAPAPRPKPPPPAPPHHEPADSLRAVAPGRLFATGPELVRAVIAAEVLGKPRALRDE